MRRGEIREDSKVKLSNKLLNFLHTSLVYISHNLPNELKHKPNAKQTCTMYTDASCKGFGFVLVFENGEIRTGGSRWFEDKNEIEARTLLLVKCVR